VITALGERFGLPLEVRLGTNQTVPHARELRIDWEDGRSWKLRADHGFGFLRVDGHPTHRFGDSASRQATALADLAIDVRAYESAYFYIFPVG
jgi:DEAD/DEAH box helicase domain-containing protein